jgi:hypothetical protein
LLLLPGQQIFEHVGFEYDSRLDCAGEADESSSSGGILVSEVLEQLPDLATDPEIASAKFVGLVSVGTNTAAGEKENAELVNSRSIQSHHLNNDDVLVAVPEGKSAFGILKSAESVLQNKKILRAVSRL